MPYQQAWQDPSSGFTFSQSYVRVLKAQARPVENSVGLVVARYANVTCYSGGFQPLEQRDITVQGGPYTANFAAPVSAALASFNLMVYNTSDTYIGTLSTLSGAQVVP